MGYVMSFDIDSLPSSLMVLYAVELNGRRLISWLFNHLISKARRIVHEISISCNTKSFDLTWASNELGYINLRSQLARPARLPCDNNDGVVNNGMKGQQAAYSNILIRSGPATLSSFSSSLQRLAAGSTHHCTKGRGLTDEMIRTPWT